MTFKNKQTEFLDIVLEEIQKQSGKSREAINIVSYVWTLGNLKAVLGVRGLDEDDYYEATYDKEHNCIYLVTYNKTNKTVL